MIKIYIVGRDAYADLVTRDFVKATKKGWESVMREQKKTVISIYKEV